MKSHALVALALVSLVLAGCGSGAKSYNTVVELRDAAIEAGLPCPGWTMTNVSLAKESATCSDSSTLSVYTSTAARDEQLKNTDNFLGGALGKQVRLVGPNWILSYYKHDLTPFQKKLGGEIQK
jgi:hypothetical protein